MLLRNLFYVLFCFTLLAPPTAQANVVVRTADQLEVSENDIVDGELVAVGLPVVLSNNVTEDATLLGNRVKVNATIGGDLLAAGFFVDLDALVSDDVRIVGGEVRIANEIAGDLIVLGGTVDILSTASVAGDVVVYGGAVTVAGDIGGDIVGVMETLSVNGSVAGGIDVYVTTLSLGEQASVAGAVQYTSYNLLTQSLGATISGDTVRSDPVILQESSWLRMLVLMFLVGLFSSLIWYLLSRRTLEAVTLQSTTQPLRSALVGLIAHLLLFLVITVLLVSQLGAYVGFLLLFGLITLVLLAGAAAPAVVGQLALQVAAQPQPVGPWSITLGVLLLTVCLFIPVVGWFLVFVAVTLTLGGLCEALLEANR